MESGELYELIGHNWRFPVWVRWISHSQVEVRVADIPVLKRQQEVVRTLLHGIAQHFDAGVFYLSRKALETSTIKSTFLDPEEVVIWQRTVSDHVAVEVDFVQAYCASRDAVIRNANTFEVMWGSICKFLLEWTLIHGKTADFGFAKLDAICARENWKSIIIGRLVARKQSGALLSNDPETIRRLTRKLLHQNSLTAIDLHSNTVRWTLEMTPTKKFHDAAEIVEMKRKIEAGPGHYLYRVLRFLKTPTHKNRLHELLTIYTREVQRPLAPLSHGFVPRLDDDGNEPEIMVAASPKWIQAPMVLGASSKAGNRRALVPKDALLPTLSDLQQVSPNVWNAGEKMDTAQPDAGNPGGMPVLPADEKCAGSELLALQPDGGDSGLAASPEQFPNQPNGTGNEVAA